MKRTTFDLSDEHHRRLKVCASHLGVSMTDVVREMIESWIDRAEVGIERDAEYKKKKRGGALRRKPGL